MTYGIPKRIDRGNHFGTTIYSLKNQMEECEKDPDTFNPTRTKTVLGFPIPSWQRPLVWTTAQRIKLIESIWYGYDIGTYTYCAPKFLSEDVSGTSFLLIDGQQRMDAIQRYWQDEFDVFGLFWSEVPHAEQRRFYGEKFPSYEMEGGSEQELKDAYNRMNFGGVNHTEDQRA